MKTTYSTVAVAACLAALLGGCAIPATPTYDAKFGEAVRQAQSLQALYPEAGTNADPVTGIDGQSGKHAVDRYQDSFKAPPRSFEVFDIGGTLQDSQ